MNSVSFKSKFITLPLGYRKSLSPMFIIGNLIASGLTPEKAGILATYIIDDIPAAGATEEEFIEIFLSYLPETAKRRFLTLDMMKKFLVSPRSKSPLFIFLGGFTGKTFLTSYVQQHLGINRVTALDDEKYYIRKNNPDHEHLYKSTYEEMDTYEKTLEDFIPRMKDRLGENIHDYNDKKKWTYFWEGIYFTAEMIERIKQEYPQIDILCMLLIPPFEQIKERYVIRWMSELGRKYIEDNKTQIDQYIKNVEHIKEVMLKNVDKTPECVIIENEYFDDVLALFYQNVHNRLNTIAEREGIAYWIDQVLADRKKIVDYEKYLEQS